MTATRQPFLFIFGFEGPAEHRTNETAGTDFESSWSFLVEAENADAALSWGRQLAEEFVELLFEQAGINGYSWASGNFAHWISDEPAEITGARSDTAILGVRDGQMPDFSGALRHWKDQSQASHELLG